MGCRLCRAEGQRSALGMKSLFVFAALIMGPIARTAPAAVVGGWNGARGGVYSLSDGSSTSTVRTLLTEAFPDTTFSGAGTLTPAYLSTLDAVVLSVAYDNSTGVTALSPSEQSALMNFVLAGGRALLLGERTGFAPATNASLINPFGLHISGDLFGHLPGTVPQPLLSDITSQPFGEVDTVTTINPGWFDQIGLATPLATLDFNGKPILGVLAGGALGPGSGRVVLASDSDLYAVAANAALIGNTFAVLVPEPSTLCLALLGGAMGAVAWRRRALQRRG